MSKQEDPDETEGRRLYRARADALANFQVNLAMLKPVIRRDHITIERLAVGKPE